MSFMSGKLKANYPIGKDKFNSTISSDLAPTLKGSLLSKTEDSSKLLKRTWKLDKASTREANSFTPKTLIKTDPDAMPSQEDIIDYLMNTKLSKYTEE